MNRFVLCILLTIISLVRTDQTAHAQKATPKITVSYTSFNMPAAIVWIAKEERLFAKYGLNEELIFIPGGPTAMSALVSGNIDFAQLTGSPGAYAYVGGADVVYLAATMDVMSYQIVARPDMRRVQDLKGKRIGISRFGASPDVAVRMALRKLGLNPDTDVSIIQTGGSPERLAALLGGKVDATVLNAPFDRVAKNHNLVILADTGKLELAYFDTGIVTTRKFVKAHEEVVRQFMKVYVEAVSVFKTKKARTLAIASRYARVSDTDALEEAYAYFVDKIPRYPYPTLPGMQTVLDELARGNPKARNVKPGDLVDGRFVKELESAKFSDPYYK
jgi:NitT/TauT family transport system substrate-binding protein